MMNAYRVCALLLVLVFFLSCERNQQGAQQDSIQSATKDTVTAYGPTTMVRNVKQDRNGNILLAASRTGVLRYDGKSFTNLTSSRIGPRRFWDVLEDRRGNLWLSSTDSGVYYYDPRRTVGKSVRHFTTKDGLASNSVGSMYEDKTGRVWFATRGGVSRYDPRQAGGKSFRNFTTKDGLPNNDVTTILEDKAGKIWIGTRGEACLYDGTTFTVFRNKDGKPFNNVWGITQDKTGNIWFGATIIEARKGDTLIVSRGLWRYDGSSFTKVNQRGASSIIEDKKGAIWTTGDVNSNGIGAWKLLLYDPKSLYAKQPTVTEILSIDKMLCGILAANDGSIWFGSLSGVYLYDGKAITDFKQKEGSK